jgi:pyruvate kinase
MAEIGKKEEKIRWLIDEISAIIERLEHFEAIASTELSEVHPKFIKSARNFIHYCALRKEDIRPIQKKLANLGLSRLDKPESHVMASLLASKAILEGFLNNEPIKKHKAQLTFKKSNRMGKSNAKALLGYRSKGRRTRIMVTLPTAVAYDYQLAHDLIASGMNCARINCAHDSEKEWRLMIEHIRTASEKLKKKCKISMDLGGPKVRTGALPAGPKVKKFRPAIDVQGRVIQDCELWMGPLPHPKAELPHLPVAVVSLKKLKAGDQLFFMDTRDKKREITITKKTKYGCIAQCGKTTFLETGMQLYTNAEYSSAPIVVGEIPRAEEYLRLHTGDFLRLHKDTVPGGPALRDADGNVTSPAHISCTSAEIFEQVGQGEPVFFDDGKIEGRIRRQAPDELLIEIVNTRKAGCKLRADKGINFPDSDLELKGLTAKDKKDLAFVVENADIVNLSYVNQKQDVRDLLAALQKLKAPAGFGIILKIETQSGFNKLREILLEAMKTYPVGVMIARGDLAIECGWDNISRVQREILSLCRAAHIPEIWATQVLENLSKQGIPSRAEMTDAAMAQRTDCVMLNKGPYILQAIELLSTIFKDMEPYQEKNVRLWPAMERADIH